LWPSLRTRCPRRRRPREGRATRGTRAARDPGQPRRAPRTVSGADGSLWGIEIMTSPYKGQCAMAG